MTLFRTSALLFLFLGFFLRIVPSSGMKEPLLHVTTNEPRLVFHVPELRRESRTTSSEENSKESSQEIESPRGILASEESTTHPKTHPRVNSEFLKDLIQNISSLHGAFKKSREHVGLETRHFTGIGRPRALLPPGQKRRRRVLKGHFNRTKPHVSSNPHVFAREGGDMEFGSKRKSKALSDITDDGFNEENIEDAETSSLSARRPITLAPPIYKPGPAIVKIAPDLEDLKVVGLIKDHEYEKLKKEKALKTAMPMEIMKLKDQITSDSPDSEVKIPTYIVTSTFKPSFLNKNIVLDKIIDDNMALYVETEYSPTYSVPPHVLLSMMPNFDFRKYNVSSFGDALTIQDGQQHFNLQQSSLSVPLPSPFYFNSLSPTASSFIPPNPTPPFGRPTSTPYPGGESSVEEHQSPLGPPVPSSMHSAPRRVYQPPRTYLLSTVSPGPLPKSPASSVLTNPPANSLHPGKAFMPPVVKYTTFEPLSNKHEAGDLEHEHESGDLFQRHHTRKETSDTRELVSYSPGFLTPIPATFPPTLPPDSSEDSKESLVESSSGEVGSFAPHSFSNHPPSHPPPFESSRETSHPIKPIIHHHRDSPVTYTPIPQASRPAFPHRLPYPPPSPSPVPPFRRPTPTHRPTPSFVHRPVPPSLPPPIPPNPFPTRNQAKTYRLTTPKPTQDHHLASQPTEPHRTSDRRDKTLLNYNNKYWEPTINSEIDSPIPKYPTIEVHRKSPKPVFVLPDHLHTTPRPNFAPTSRATDYPRRRYPTPKLLRKPPQHVIQDYHPELDRPLSNEIFSNGIIPGVPGVANEDYPAYSSIPKTSFTCHGKVIGYYADPEARCQVFHTCEFGNRRSSFLCPNGTLFNQQVLTCDHWRNVDCDRAVNFYQINKKIYAVQDKKSYPYRRKKHTEPRSSKVHHKHQDRKEANKIHSGTSRPSVRATVSAAMQQVSSRDSKPLTEISAELATEPHRIVPRPSSTRSHQVVIQPLVTESIRDVSAHPITQSPTFAPTSLVTDPQTFESTPVVTDSRAPTSASDVPYPTYPIDLPTTPQPQLSRPPPTLSPLPPPTSFPPPLPTTRPPSPPTSPPPPSLPTSLPPPPPQPAPPSPVTYQIEQDHQHEFLPVIQSMKPHYVNPLKVKPYVP